MEKSEIIEQTRLAFDFIQRLYLETSYFIKEISGILQQEEEEFQILRPSGYGITTFRSTGLESTLVEDWLTRKGAVFFAANADTGLSRGQTITKLKPNLKVIFIYFLLCYKELTEPEVWAGIISNIVQKVEQPKFESLTWKFAYHDKRILKNPETSTYEDSDVTFDLDAIRKPLYDMSDSTAIQREVIEPLLSMYRES